MTLSTTETTTSPSSRWTILKSIAKWTICAVVLIVVGVVLVRQFRGIPWREVHFDLLDTLLATACIVGVSLTQLVARWTLLLAYGYHLSWRRQVGVSFVPQLGKYLPGGVASVAGAVYLLRQFNVPVAVGLSVTILLDGLAVVAGLIVSTPLLFTAPVREKMPLAWLGTAILLACGIVVMHPHVFVALINRVLKKFRKQPIAEPPDLREYIWPVLASFAQWLIAGLGLWFMARGVHGVEIRTTPNTHLIPLFIASAALAMTVSYLAPFAPAGLGLRELIYLLTLGPTIGPALAAIVVVAMRLIQTLVEVALAAFGALMLRDPPSRGL